MSENRFWFVIDKGKLEYVQDNVTGEKITVSELEDLLNEQQELIEELQVSDEMGWKRAEHFEKKCPKELHNQKMYIKRLEYKVQKFKEENEQLKQKIQRWKTLYEIKDKEVTARVKRLNKICNQYKYAITFDKDIDPNDAVNILCDRILQTEVEM